MWVCLGVWGLCAFECFGLCMGLLYVYLSVSIFINKLLSLLFLVSLCAGLGVCLLCLREEF